MQGIKDRIAAPASDNIVNQILPKCYDYKPQLNPQGQAIPPTRTHTGLIGSLPILISLAAFSAHESLLQKTLQEHVQMNEWIPHGHPTGRQAERGMIIKICYDPANAERSTEQNLDALRDGYFGAFYNG